MSVSSDFKRSLLTETPKNRCCRIAFVAGLFAGGGSVAENGTVTLRYTDPTFPTLFSSLLVPYDKKATFTVGKTVGKSGFLSVDSKIALAYLSEEPIAFPTLKCKDCRGFFLGGIFAACGRISDPEKQFRVELSCGENRERIASVLERAGVPMTGADRRNERILYLKNLGRILDFFAVMGRSDFYFTLMNSSIEREIRNEANRVANCEANNIAKAIGAADRQVKAIRYLEERKLIGTLSHELTETAELRLAHPDMTLSQLAAAAVPAITKAGLNHRLQQLVSIADKYRAEATAKNAVSKGIEREADE